MVSQGVTTVTSPGGVELRPPQFSPRKEPVSTSPHLLPQTRPSRVLRNPVGSSQEAGRGPAPHAGSSPYGCTWRGSLSCAGPFQHAATAPSASQTPPTRRTSAAVRSRARPRRCTCRVRARCHPCRRAAPEPYSSVRRDRTLTGRSHLENPCRRTSGRRPRRLRCGSRGRSAGWLGNRAVPDRAWCSGG